MLNSQHVEVDLVIDSLKGHYHILFTLLVHKETMDLHVSELLSADSSYQRKVKLSLDIFPIFYVIPKGEDFDF